MRIGLIVFAIFFLVIGGFLYITPTQQFEAKTTVTGETGPDVRTSSAMVTVPQGWSLASIAIGGLLLLFGLFMPDPSKKEVVRVYTKRKTAKAGKKAGKSKRKK